MAGGNARPQKDSPWKAAGAAGIGSVIEYYDFQLYAVLAVTLSPIFFPDADPATALLSTLAVFAGAFLVRPLGGVFFGWLGDRHGRKSALMATIVGMGIVSACMGLLPTYAALGIAAPILLLALRLAQGFFAGGEVTGAATYIAECAPDGKRGFFGAFTPAAATLGLTLATAVAGLVQAASGSQAMQQWGWRIPFLLSVPMIFLCVWARRRIEDSHLFQEIRQENLVVKTPLREVATQHFPSLIKLIGLGFAQNAAGYICIVYMNIHLTRVLGYDSASVFWLMSSVTLVAALLMPCAGGLSDRHGRRPLIKLALWGYVLLVPAAMYLASLQHFGLAVIAVAVSVAPFVVMQAVGYPLYAELFPTRVRYSGVSLGFNIATILGGATAPFIATWLVQKTGSVMAPAWYVVAAAALGLLTLVFVKETAHQPIAH